MTTMKATMVMTKQANSAYFRSFRINYAEFAEANAK